MAPNGHHLPTRHRYRQCHDGNSSSTARKNGAKLPYNPQLVAEERDSRHELFPKVAGYAVLSRVSGRCVYGGVAEVSIYVGNNFRGQGVGRLLLTELIRQSEENGLWMLQAGIFPENRASLALHSANGFRQVGYREKIGKHHGIWRDILLLERRSKEVGL